MANKKFLSSRTFLFANLEVEENKNEIEKLINYNITAILNRVLFIFFFVILPPYAVYLFKPPPSTLVRIDLKVKSLTWYMSAANITDKFEIGSQQNGVLEISNSNLNSSNFGVSGFRNIVIDYKKSINIKNIKFPTNAKIYLSQNEANGIILNVSSETLNNDSLFTYEIIFSEGKIYDSQTGELKKDTSGNILSAIVERNINTIENPPIEISNIAPWAWKGGILTKKIDWENENINSDKTSSILYGKINMLETNDTAIILNERDVLKTEFIDSVELFLQGDSSGVYVHLEGEVSNINAGPKKLVEKEKGNLMPMRIKLISDKQSYLWIVATILISIITIIKIRGK